MKRELRRECRRLRAAGLTYDEISARTGAPKGSISGWVRDIPVPDRVAERRARHLAQIRGIGPAKQRREAAVRQKAARAVGAARVGVLDSHALFAVGIALYWAEGTKDKPWRRKGRVIFTNGDPDVVAVFLAWLDLVGVPRGDRTFRLSIHESADVAGHERWWADCLAVDASSFLPATLKRHRPTTSRKNTGTDYHGCLVVSVRRSRTLYDVIDGAWRQMAATVRTANGTGAAH